jgi:hypothetical protein
MKLNYLRRPWGICCLFDVQKYNPADPKSINAKMRCLGFKSVICEYDQEFGAVLSQVVAIRVRTVVFLSMLNSICEQWVTC